MKFYRFLYILLTGKILLFEVSAYPVVYNEKEQLLSMYYGRFQDEEYFAFDYSFKKSKFFLGLKENNFIPGFTLLLKPSLPFLISPFNGFSVSIFKDKKFLLFFNILFPFNLKYLNFTLSPGYLFSDDLSRFCFYFDFALETVPNIGVKYFFILNLKKETLGYSLFINF